MFTKDNTKQLKGIAILLMLFHHLVAFPDKIPVGINLTTDIVIMERELLEWLGGFGQICVSLYMFLGGYGLYRRVVSEGEHDVIRNNLVKDIVNLYKAYWKVFLVFVPIGLLFFDNQAQYCMDANVCIRFADDSVGTMIKNFMGLGYSYNSEWWFLWYYLFALFEGYVFIEIFKNKRSIYIEYAVVVIWSIYVGEVFPILPFKDGLEPLWSNAWFKYICLGSDSTILFLVGIIFAKYRILENWKNMVSNLKSIERILVAAVATILIMWTGANYEYTMFEIVLVPLFVFVCCVFVDTCKWSAKPLKFLGEHSTNMWLVHTFYCYYFGAVSKIVYASNNAIISFVTLVVLSLGTSIVLNRFWKIMGETYAAIMAKG